MYAISFKSCSCEAVGKQGAMLTPTEFETQFETQFETSEKDVLSDVLLKSSSELCVRYQGAEVFARLTLECMFGAQEWKYPV